MLWSSLLCLLWFLPDGASSASLNTPKVQLTLYYESLCPDCQFFIKQQLFPTYQKLGEEIFNLTLVPYGNAEERKRGDEWIFDCQHGQKECDGNIIETCAISLIKSFNTTFHFVHCFEEYISRTQEPRTAAEKCAQQLGIDYAPIEACHEGPLGNKLEHEMALKTDALQPSHEYVPWVTLNGKHTEKIQRQAESNLLELICSYYTGPKPEACDKQRPAGRCYRNSFLAKF